MPIAARPAKPSVENPRAASPPDDSLAPAETWFMSLGREPFPFQREAWRAYLDGRGGLVNAPTGMGKTFAVWMGPLLEWIAENPGTPRVPWGDGPDPSTVMKAASTKKPRPTRGIPKRTQEATPPLPPTAADDDDGSVLTVAAPSPAPALLRALGLKEAEPARVLWLTPLRALANDTLEALRGPVAALGLPWTVELRTGDTEASARARQRVRLPTVLVTTPESLCVQLSHAEARARLSTLRCVVVDEWHELIGTKRGTQTELALARLKAWCPGLRVWGLSATLANLTQAMETLSGPAASPDQPNGSVLIRHAGTKEVAIQTLLPAVIDRFPWVGHLGTNLVNEVVAELEKARVTLMFVNVRSGAELWYRALLAARPDWESDIDLHHGSLDRAHREAVEARLRAGTIRCVVCTSSLDLGVDFPAVDQVIQVGSPKGVARLMQRAGRSGHQPGRPSRVLCVPTHAFELVEYAAARDAVEGVTANAPGGAAPAPPGGPGPFEPRAPLERPLDVLVQHLVTAALGGGFFPEPMYDEVRLAASYRDLTRDEFQWCLDFIVRGGSTLGAYPQFRRVDVAPDGLHSVTSPSIARLHRLGIGTITGENTVNVKWERGGTLGTVEENFIAAMKPGTRFVFAGRALELVRMRDMTAEVKIARKATTLVPRWAGAKMPLSSHLSAMVRARMDAARTGRFEGPEMAAIQPILAIQARWSHIPSPDELLIETVIEGRDGPCMVFVFPFEGRAVHEGLGALVAHRAARRAPRTITIMVNDYGFQFLSPEPFEPDEAEWQELFSEVNLTEDLLDCLNSTELARRQFREVARVAGLVFSGYPGQPKNARQVQASAGLLFDVFTRFDPDNPLIDQARREVLDRQLEIGRLRATLARIAGMRLVFARPPRLTPLAFPLWAQRVEAEVTTEPWQDRVARMSLELEEAAEHPDPPPPARPGSVVPDPDTPVRRGLAEMKITGADNATTGDSKAVGPPDRKFRRKRW